MSVLDRFEKSVEGAVNGVFAKFGSKDLKPVDLSSALEREIDKEAMPVTRDRTVAPNEYRFKLSTPDFNNIVEWGAETLANELADNLTQYAKSQNYAFVGPVVVIFEEDLELSKGDYRLSSESVQGNTVPVTTDAQTEDCPMRSASTSICSPRKRPSSAAVPIATSSSTTPASPVVTWRSTSPTMATPSSPAT